MTLRNVFSILFFMRPVRFCAGLFFCLFRRGSLQLYPVRFPVSLYRSASSATYVPLIVRAPSGLIPQSLPREIRLGVLKNTCLKPSENRIFPKKKYFVSKIVIFEYIA